MEANVVPQVSETPSDTQPVLASASSPHAPLPCCLGRSENHRRHHPHGPLPRDVAWWVDFVTCPFCSGTHVNVEAREDPEEGFDLVATCADCGRFWVGSPPTYRLSSLARRGPKPPEPRHPFPDGPEVA